MARILCVDDHTYALSGTIAALQHEGHTIVTINGRNPALHAVADDEVDLLLLDCHASDTHRNLIAAVRILRPEIPVVMTSGFCSLPCEKLRDADACIQKGDTAALGRTIQTILCASKYGLCRSVAA